MNRNVSREKYEKLFITITALLLVAAVILVLLVVRE